MKLIENADHCTTGAVELMDAVVLLLLLSSSSSLLLLLLLLLFIAGSQLLDEMGFEWVSLIASYRVITLGLPESIRR